MVGSLSLSHLQSRPTKRRAASVVAGIGLSLLVLVSNGLADTPTIEIDGHFDSSEGYTNGYIVTFTDDDGDPATGNIGEVWLHEDTDPQSSTFGNVSVALILPLTLKDNTFGDNSTFYTNNNAFQDFNGGGNGLTGSDKAKFVLKNGGGATTTVNMDFITGFTDSTLSTKDKDDGPFFASGFTGEDHSPSPGSQPAVVLAAASSMGYNFGLFGNSSTDPDDPPANYPFGTNSNSPQIVDKDDESSPADYTLTGTGLAFAGWDFNHSYEFQVTSAAFGAGFDITSQTEVAAQLLLNEIHISPKKLIARHMVSGEIGDPISGGDSSGPGDSPSAIPEPSSVTLALLGLVGLCGAQWRRRKNQNRETAAS